MKRRIIVIVIVIISIIIFISIGISSMNKDNKDNDVMKCINNSDEAIKYIMEFYNYESSETEYSILSYNEGVYSISATKDNKIYKYYTVDEKKCNISSSLIFGILDEGPN